MILFSVYPLHCEKNLPNVSLSTPLSLSYCSSRGFGFVLYESSDSVENVSQKSMNVIHVVSFRFHLKTFLVNFSSSSGFGGRISLPEQQKDRAKKSRSSGTRQEDLLRWFWTGNQRRRVEDALFPIRRNREDRDSDEGSREKVAQGKSLSTG